MEKSDSSGNYVAEYVYTISSNKRCGVEVITRGGEGPWGIFDIVGDSDDVFERIEMILG